MSSILDNFNIREEIGHRELQLILSFLVIMMLFLFVVQRVNDYKIQGVYKGELDNGEIIIGNCTVELPYDLNIPDKFIGMRLLLDFHGFSYDVYVLRDDPIPVENMYYDNNF